MYEPLDEDIIVGDTVVDPVVTAPPPTGQAEPPRTEATSDETPPESAPQAVPNPEQEACLDVLMREPFVDLSGTAGVGKTRVAMWLAERFPGLVLTSTTGIAAVNLGEGQTINSLLMYYNTESLREAFVGGYLQTKLRRLRHAGLRKILLDEKSMLDAHQLTMIVRAIDEVNQGKALQAVGEGDAEQAEEAESHEGDDAQLGLILVGDFGQLPPVKAPFAFESAEWKRFADHRVKLTTIVRQTDQAFIRALHDVREGKVRDALSWFTENKFSDLMDEGFDGTTIFAKNDSVDRYNQLRLDQCPGEPVGFSSVRWGKQSGEWKQIPEVMSAKIGALVMVLANRRYPKMDEDDEPPMLYCNGDLGVIEGVSGDRKIAHVRLRRTGGVVPVKLVTREFLIPMEVGRRKELREAGTPELIKDRFEIAGTITYMPLRLAWGTTVHKSQGLSLDNVQINIRDHFFSSPSMLFVALSRARTPQGLRIVGNQKTFIARCAVNKLVVPWL